MSWISEPKSIPLSKDNVTSRGDQRRTVRSNAASFRIRRILGLRSIFWRLIQLRRVLVRFLAVGMIFVVVPWAALEGYRAWLRTDAEWSFVENVLLNWESGDDDRVVMRWTVSPTIGLIDASSSDDAFIREIVSEFSRVMTGSGVSVRLGAREASDIKLIFAPQERFSQIAENYGETFNRQSSGYFVIWPRQGYAIERAIGVIRSDLTGDERRATIVHELAHMLGLRSHSSLFVDSVLYSHGAHYSSGTHLASADRKLLRLLYMDLKPGQGWFETRLAYKRASGK